MNLIAKICMAMTVIVTLANCNNKRIIETDESDDQRENAKYVKIVYVHDTITKAMMPEGTFYYNLPCKVVNIHQEKEGKSLLFIWLHGGVHDRKMHNLFEFNHLDCCAADDSVLNYLQEKNIKSIALFPICHKAQNANCVAWKDCYDDVMRMIKDLDYKGLIDPKRIYLAGSSDGGVGTWDFLQYSEHVFAAAMPMSCGNPRKATIPVYFFNTQAESDCTSQVEFLNQHGSTIEYKHSPARWHGRDDIECTHAFLDKFFSNTRK